MANDRFGSSLLEAVSLPQPPLTRLKIYCLFIAVHSLSHIRLFVTPWTSARRASLSFAISQSLPKFMPVESKMPSNHLILCCPLLLLPSIFPSISVFSSELALDIRWLFTSGSQSTGASALASVHRMNIQCWFLLGLTGLISLLSKVWLSRIFSNTTVWRHQFFCAQPFLLSSSHIHTWLLEKS